MEYRSQKLIRLLAFATAALVFPGLAGAATDDSLSEAAQMTLQRITSKYSLAGDRYPETRQLLEKIFERISAVQMRDAPQGLIMRNSVYLIDSGEINAFVVRTPSPGMSRIENQVFVTTAAVRACLSEDATGIPPGHAKETLKEGEVLLANVLGHELRHPAAAGYEGFPDSLTQRYQEAHFSEFDSDIGGARYAEEAGYPRGGMTRVLNFLGRVERTMRQGVRLVGSALSSHPNTAARGSATRIHKSSLRYSKGAEYPTQPNSLPSLRLWQELTKIGKDLDAKQYKSTVPKPRELPQGIDWTFNPPSSLQEIAQRLTQLSVSGVDPTYSSLEINRLYLSMTKMLRQRSPNSLDAAEWSAVRQVLSHVFLGREPYDYTSAQAMFIPETHSEAFLNEPLWRESVQNDWVFRSQEVQDWFGHNVKPHLRKVMSGVSDRHKEIPEAVRLGSLFLAPKEALKAYDIDRSYYHAELIGALEQADPTVRFAYAESILKDAFEKPLYREEIPGDYKQGKLAQALGTKPPKVKVLNDWGIEPTLYLLWGSPERYGGQTFLEMAGKPLTERNLATLSPSQRQAAIRKQRDLVRWILFKYGGRIAAADALQAVSNVPWDNYFRISGWTPEEGAALVMQRLSEFLKSPDSSDVLEFSRQWLGSADRKRGRNGYGSSSSQPKQGGRPWLDEAFLDACQAMPATLRDTLYTNALSSEPRLFDSIFEKYLDEKLSSLSSAESAHAGWFDQLTSEFIKAHHLEKTAGYDISRGWLRSILNCKDLAPNQQHRLLEKLFLPDHRPYSKLFTASDSKDEDMIAVAKELKSIGVIESVTELARSMKPSAASPAISFNSYQKQVSALAPLLKEEFEAKLAREPTRKGRLDVIWRIEHDFINPQAAESEPHRKKVGAHRLDAFDYYVAKISREVSTTLRGLQESVRAAAHREGMKGAELTSFFREVTTVQRPSPASDELIEKRIAELLKQPLTRPLERELRSYLDEGRLWNDKLKLKIAATLLSRNFSSRRSPKEAETSLNTLQRWIPSSSLEKDQLLERMAWKYQLKGDSLRLLEEMKSGNWKLTSPGMMRLGSAGAEILVKLDDKPRRELILWLSGKLGKELPKSVEDNIARIMRLETNRFLSVTGHDALRDRSGAIEAEAQKWKQTIESSLLDLKAEEKLPIFEMALASGPENLAENESDVDRFMRKCLNLDPLSKEGRLLKIIFKHLPGDEKAAHLAYLLSVNDGGQLDVAKIYEALGPFGIRLAQMVQRWDLFGPEHSARIRHLTYDAKKMSLYEIQQAIQKHPDLDKMVAHFVEIKGCGTNRCAVEVLLHDGRRAMLMVQRPDARAQIEGMFEFTEAVLKDAREQNLVENLEMAEVLLHDLRPQMLSELDGIAETEKIAKAQAAIREVSQSPEIQAVLKGRKIVVPGLLEGTHAHEDMFLMDFFDGKPLAEGQDPAIGEAIVRINLKMRLSRGVGDADRHKGQYLVSSDGQRVGVTDTAGWWYEFTGSDLPHWHDFMKASVGRDASAIFDAAVNLCQMPKRPQPRDKTVAAIEQAITKAGTDLKAKAIGIVQALQRDGWVIEPRFKYGGIMETLTQRAEQFVPEGRFDSLYLQETLNSFQQQKNRCPDLGNVAKLLSPKT